MQRLIELFIDTNTLEFYNRDGALGASTPSISAGELVQLNVQLCDGAPDFDESGAVKNPDTRFSGSSASAEFVVDNNYNWYDPVTLVNAVTSGSAIETLEIQSTTTPRPLGTIVLGGTDYVNYCEAVKTETGYLLTLADAEFSPASFTPSVNCDAGSAARNIERPVIVSAQNDSTGRETGLFTGLLDAANPVYESLIEGNKEISGTILELNVYDGGRSVFRARFDFDCLGSIAYSASSGYIKSNAWTESDSRYLKLSGGTLTGELKSTAYNTFRMIQGEYGTFFRNDGRNLYILVTNAGDQNGAYNDFRPLSVNLSTGQCDISGTAQKAISDGNGNNIVNTYAQKSHPTFLQGIEISGGVPYIDFHFNQDTGDYTSRIYETAAGTLTVVGKLSVSGGIAPRYNAQTDITSAYTSGGNSYTFTGGGWLYAVTSAGGSYAINDGTVVSAASGATASCCVPVNKGDTVTGSAAGTLIFYPY